MEAVPTTEKSTVVIEVMHWNIRWICCICFVIGCSETIFVGECCSQNGVLLNNVYWIYDIISVV